jgi:sec-independent protein translocase protein TatB
VFDVSFVELLVIGVVALIVLGPEKLPGAARTAGTFVRRARQSWNNVRAEFERQLAVEDVRRNVREVREAVEAEPSSPAPKTGPASAAATPTEPAPGEAQPARSAPHD